MREVHTIRLMESNENRPLGMVSLEKEKLQSNIVRHRTNFKLE